MRDTTTRSRIRVPWQRRSYIEANIFVMTYMNPWPDRWRGSNDLGRAAAASVRPAKLCDWIKISHVSQLVPCSHVCRSCAFGGSQRCSPALLRNWCQDLVNFRNRWVPLESAWGARPSPRIHAIILPERRCATEDLLVSPYRSLGLTA